MPSEWCMVAYLLDGRALQNLNEKINFDDGLTLGPIDQWMREQSILADIGRFQRGYVRSARHTISITYEADSHEDESQQLALERLCLVNESLWLAAPCSVSFRGCFGLQSVDGAWVPQAAPIGPPLTAFYSYA